MFSGVFTALITPFKSGAIDYESLKKLIEHQMAGGIQGFVVCGTTAESPTLSNIEKLEILDFILAEVKGKVPIIFGSGSNCTRSTIELSLKACERDIDGLLVVAPYYNKPTQRGLIQHFTAVANNVSKPVVLYNVPGRTIVEIEPDTVVELSHHKNICGIKEANSDINNFSKYKNRVAPDFCFLSGDDNSCISFCLLGAHGVISVCSHIAPKKMQQWIIIDEREMRLPLTELNNEEVNELSYILKEFTQCL